jgi:hypothetical protein
MKIQSQILTLIHHLTFFKLGRKKISVVPVSYREKIRVGRSEIIFFKYFFHGFGGFLLGRFAVESRHQY